MEAVRNDCAQRFGSNEAADKVHIHLAYSGTDLTEANIWKQEVQEAFPDHEIIMRPLSLSISCHIGPGAIGNHSNKDAGCFVVTEYKIGLDKNAALW